MNIIARRITATLIGALLVGSLVACSGQSKEEKARDEAQASAGVSKSGSSLEKTNLAEKRKREENPNAIGYVYLISFGKPIGYYVTKGKISSNGSQAGPEEDIVWTCKSSHGCSPVVVDSAQDDGSYGDGDPGIFFFTSDGTKVVSDLDYVQSDQPLALNVPKLG